MPKVQPSSPPLPEASELPTLPTPSSNSRHSPCAPQVENNVTGSESLSSVGAAGTAMSSIGVSDMTMDIEACTITNIQMRSVTRKESFVIPQALELSDSKEEEAQVRQSVVSAKRPQASKLSAASKLKNDSTSRRESLSTLNIDSRETRSRTKANQRTSPYTCRSQGKTGESPDNSTYRHHHLATTPP